MPSTETQLRQMRGDYYRYMAEYALGQMKEQTTEEARACYQEALEVARGLSATSPIRLGLGTYMVVECPGH